MKIKKILHINGLRELTTGQRQQLDAEYKASLKLSDIKWDILAFHNSDSNLPFERSFPIFFRPLFLRNLYIWLILLKLQKEYDLILLRHMTFDPFALVFSHFIHNRISIHHSKEIEELPLIRRGWKGILASKLEVLSGKVCIDNSLAVIGVTQDIAEYQNKARSLNKELFKYSNGVDVDSSPIAPDNRHDTTINIAFACGYFSEWHGLDLLVDSLEKADISNQAVTIHLIGNLSKEQENELCNNKHFVIHGHLNGNSYFNVLSKCDVALGSLALYRQNMTEGSTLKVRDMLASGIPVYSTHIDTQLKKNSEFYFYDENLNIYNLIEFARKMKNIDRNHVRDNTRQYIDKSKIMSQLLLEIEAKL